MSKRTTANIEKEIIEKYLLGIPNKILAQQYYLNRGTVQQILLRNGIKLHNNSSLILCDKNFFNEYNEESCYWAGFFLADGYLRPNQNSIDLHVSIKDYEHLKNFMKCLKCEEYHRILKKKTDCRLTIFAEQLRTGLINNFNVVPNKTYICSITEKIPENLLKHFVRGYFDGDGCVTKSTTLTISFTGTTQVLNFLSSWFFGLGIRLKSRNDKPPIQPTK